MLDEGDGVKRQHSVIDVGQRNHYEAVQADVRRNQDTLTSLRRENKELRLALQQSLRGQRNINIDEHYAKEEELLHNKMCVLKRSLNAVKGKNTELAKEIERLIEDTSYVLKEGGSALEESSPIAQKIRALENRLDKCLVKHNEVNAIRRTYETLLERLQLEQAGFDTQLAATEKALQNTERELAELGEVGQDAAKARDAARADVLRLRAKLVEERKAQRHDLEQRGAFVAEKRDLLEKKRNTLLVKMAQQDERHARLLQLQGAAGDGGGGGGSRKRGGAGGAGGGGGAGSMRSVTSATLRPDELERLQRQKDAYARLKEATMASNVDAVVQALRQRRESHAQLQQTASELEAATAALRREHDALQAQWERANQRAGGVMVSARVTRAARDAYYARNGGGRGGDATTASRVSGGDDGSSSGSAEGSDDTAATTSSASAAAGGGAAAAAATRSANYALLGDRSRERAKVVDEFTAHLRERAKELDEAQKQLERLVYTQQHVDVGVRHLAEKLMQVCADYNNSNNNGNGNGGTVAVTQLYTELLEHSTSSGGGDTTAATTHSAACELLRACEVCLQRMLDELTPDEVARVAARLMAMTTYSNSGSNVRSNNSSAAAAGIVVVGGGGGGAPSSSSSSSSLPSRPPLLLLPETNVRLPGLVTSAAGLSGADPLHEDYTADNDRDDATNATAGGVAARLGRKGGLVAAATAGGGGNNAAVAGGGGGILLDEFPDSEIHDRVELKMMSLATVEREEKKARKQQQQQQQQRRKDDTA